MQEELSSSTLSEAMKILNLLSPAKPAPTPAAKLIKTEILLAIVTCNLCKVTTQQYMELNIYSDGAKIKGRDLDSGPDNCESYKTTVRTCWNCKSYLTTLDKPVLVDMYLSLYNPHISRRDISILIAKERQRSFLKEEGKNI